MSFHPIPRAPLAAAVLALAAAGCAQPGQGGENPTDCGGHGTLHEGHCHCDSGYLFDGRTCLDPEALTEECADHEPAADAGGEHHHEACRCPSSGACHCEEGTLVTLGSRTYCAPDLDHD